MKKLADPASLSFEQALSELETLVERLEQGELTLEAALADFERGIGLSRACEQALESAEQRVRILTEARSDANPDVFDTHD